MAISHPGDPHPVSFSIITVVFNGEKLLRDTMESVRIQSWPHIEYIIVDGASSDGTMDIVREY
ncbi:MAG: glycosyltransferase, partial [Bacteroidota bacterium]